MAGSFPEHWYQYEFPLPKVENAPVPSEANYSQHNCAWLIEMFAQVLGQNHTDIRLRYENNTPDNPHDDIFVTHPDDGLYLTTESLCRQDSPEMIHYEQKAKQSEILKLFEKFAPAGEDINYLEYFKDLGCNQFFSVSFIMPPKNIWHYENVAGYLGETLDTVDLDKIDQPVYAHDSDTSYLTNTSPDGSLFLYFDDLPPDAPEDYTSVTIRWVDRCILGTGNNGGVTIIVGGETKETNYTVSTGYAYHQLTWAERDFTKDEVNSLMLVYHQGADDVTKRLTSVELVAQAVE